ncbi:MAG: hypothetical protein U0Y10_02285 [Spirosomataceae bacterium]
MVFECDICTNIIGVYDEIPQIKVSTNKRALKEQYIQKNVIYIDLHGFCYKIIDVTVISKFIPYWEAIITFKRWYNLKITVSKEPFKQMPFEEFKHLVLKGIEANKSYWENVLLYKEAKKAIEKCNSFNDVSLVLK